MKDMIVVENLRKRGLTAANMEEILMYEAIEKKPRYLDKAPKKLNFVKASEITTYGCCSEFILCYNDIKSGLSLDQAVVDLPTGRRFCDPNVFIALQALIQQGYTMSEGRAAACFELFKVLTTTPGAVLTVGRVQQTLNSYQSNSYYESELIKALQVCLFNEKMSVVYWVGLCEYVGFYSKAIELGKDVIRKNCETEKDVEKFLKPLRKEATQDKEFMSGVYKQAANKWLIPMLFYLKDSNPEALDPGGKGGAAC